MKLAIPRVLDPPPYTPTLDDRELATVLAALRHWQHIGMHHAKLDTTTAWGTVDALTEAEIDQLCERLER